jgi:putative phosphoesterase
VNRVAVISDVHGNAVALAAVLEAARAAEPDLYVFGGDLTWGSLVEETVSLVEPLADDAVFVRGNAERALADGDRSTERAQWMQERHASERPQALLARHRESAVVEIGGLGAVRFCHGSPRTDEELITDETPAERFRALMSGVGEKTLVSAHTHLQFDRRVDAFRSVNPGSVGMAYGSAPGFACWALLGPDVELMRTPFDVDETARRYRASGDPLAETMVGYLESPPTRDEIVEHAERVEFSG